MQASWHGDADVASFALPPHIAGAHVRPDTFAVGAAYAPKVTFRSLAEIFHICPTVFADHLTRVVADVPPLVVLKPLIQKLLIRPGFILLRNQASIK